MVTNINLSSPEIEEKRTLSGKPALVFSVFLLVVVFGALFALIYLKNSYISQQNEITAQITAEKSKISGPVYADVFDFQNRLNLLDKTIGDHTYWNTFLVNMGSYIVPEVRLTKLTSKEDVDGANVIDISGVAQSLDALSRELILLKELPNLDSLEFKGAGESLGDQNNQPAGIAFNASLKVNKEAFQKINTN